jgi:transcription elongation factor S-II
MSLSCRQNGGVNPRYKAKYRSLIFNLKDAANPDLRRRVLSGEIPGARHARSNALHVPPDR